MTEEHEAPIDPDALGWSAPRAPDGFATRAVDAFLADGETAAPVRKRWPYAVGLAVAVAIVLVTVWPRGVVRGDHAASSAIATVAVHDRALAVARPGAALRWQVEPDGSARVEQNAGRVFYRVEEGGAFEVQTPAGTVRVTGTCFDVEIKTMNQGKNMKAAAIGAALASAVLVTVYEGGVVLANDRGEVAVAAGERAVADDDAPRRLTGRDADEDPDAARSRPEALGGEAASELARQTRALEQARQDASAQAEVIERLREQVKQLGGNPGEPGPAERAARAKACASQSRGGDCPFLDPDEETLLEMARCATVKIDHPGFVDNAEPPSVEGYAKQLGLTDPAEIAKLQKAATRHYTDVNDRLRALYLELGGDPEVAKEASPKTLESFVGEQLDQELMQDIQRRIAEERAGLREPPAADAELSLEERSLRSYADLGNEFERYLAEELGAERARALREVHDGWPGSTSVSSSDCRDPQ